MARQPCGEWNDPGESGSGPSALAPALSSEMIPMLMRTLALLSLMTLQTTATTPGAAVDGLLNADRAYADAAKRLSTAHVETAASRSG